MAYATFVEREGLVFAGGRGPRRDVVEHGIGGMASIVENNQLLLNL